eukprot:TRINITY_DN2989_c1_g1_i1.p2 TRINITY_DN2989_c1_g1~~TRINITY_DN2989_c1_g1_i1.p2  ORF type:complete len:180 (+),score=36.95 TRINITY_DN2989_c1_g1_i1:38-577(+)
MAEDAVSPCAAGCVHLATSAACTACGDCAWLAEMCGLAPVRGRDEWMEGADGRAVMVHWVPDYTASAAAGWLTALTVVLFAAGCVLAAWGWRQQRAVSLEETDTLDSEVPIASLTPARAAPPDASAALHQDLSSPLMNHDHDPLMVDFSSRPDHDPIDPAAAAAASPDPLAMPTTECPA